MRSRLATQAEASEDAQGFALRPRRGFGDVLAIARMAIVNQDTRSAIDVRIVDSRFQTDVKMRRGPPPVAAVGCMRSGTQQMVQHLEHVSAHAIILLWQG